ncbi:MAG: type II toxin-antitoxin system prevent-host-death family antitoxin [Nevskia sp.]|nr:type II toxin-antitoxin system prevent-host-death family antitoxin [Nevskia sp.]
METFTIRDLRERTGDLVRGAEQGHLAVVTKHGQPVFVAVPMDELLVRDGLDVALAVKLFQDGTLSLGKAARLSRMNLVQFTAKLAEQGIPAVDYPPEELEAELAAIG